MSSLDWDAFARLPGAATANFEGICRAVISRHYAGNGEFRYTLNQKGIEFSLKIKSTCELGDVGQMYGWQCRWYALASGTAIGTTRRRKILEALRASEAEYPEMTDWVLWTRHTLTRGDQTWFNGISTRFKLHAWSTNEVEDRLNGPATYLRATYFGEAILGPSDLAHIRDRSIAPLASRWIPDVHVEVSVESRLKRLLVVPEEWAALKEHRDLLERWASKLMRFAGTVPPALRPQWDAVLVAMAERNVHLDSVWGAVQTGNLAAICEALRTDTRTDTEGVATRRLLSRLRAFNSPAVIDLTNARADLRSSAACLKRLHVALEISVAAVLGPAGNGKTELAVSLTLPAGERPAGVVLLGSRLRDRGNLDELAASVTIGGRPCPSFEILVQALDAAGKRARCRLPIVIDGLGEAQTPSDFQLEISRALPVLRQHRHVLLIVTLRTEFEPVCIPADTPKVKLTGFRFNSAVARTKYFAHYKIAADDVDIPAELTEHPLMLRMFCEVTNPKREHMVSVSGMPGSLTALFDRHLDDVSQRVAAASTRPAKFSPHEVRDALTKIGRVLWRGGKRAEEFAALQQEIGDARLWDQSLIRLLESEGVLVRTADHSSTNLVMFAYDLLVGHVIADGILTDAGANLKSWCVDVANTKRLFEDSLHTLSTDILAGLIGLAPRRLQGQQLWKVLPTQFRQEALIASMELDAMHIDQETVQELLSLLRDAPHFASRVFSRLRRIRALPAHPLNAEFLDGVLRSLGNADRDLLWSEWLRADPDDHLRDLEVFEIRCKSITTAEPGDLLRARWVMWLCTSTVRRLRDQATSSLRSFGVIAFPELQALAIDSLSISDPYVPERVLCAAYGAALAVPGEQDDSRQRALLSGATALLGAMFARGAPHSTKHALMREYALGIINLGRMFDPQVAPESALLMPPFAHLPSPFDNLTHVPAAEIELADQSAIHMDFGNYTIGRLVPGRRNYDGDHVEYVAMRRAIVARMVQLGYSAARFEETDREVASNQYGGRGRAQRAKTERYGKKYSWIAFLEMYGTRQDEGKLDERHHDDRCSETDLDPCFPGEASVWIPTLPNLFASAPTAIGKWLGSGPQPDYRAILECDEVDQRPGPWVLTDAFVQENATSDDREVFTFCQGVFVEPVHFEKLIQRFLSVDYPGNNEIPSGDERHYTYLGEMPFAREELPLGVSSMPQPKAQQAFDRYGSGVWDGGVPVYPATQTYAWESYHSSLNLGGGAVLPSVAVCNHLGLTYRDGSFDFVEDVEVASLFRKLKRLYGGDEALTGHVAYLRRDLLERYMRETGLQYVQLVWGERAFHHRAHIGESAEMQRIYSAHAHLHRTARIWTVGTRLTWQQI